jgi:hypothetical protein
MDIAPTETDVIRKKIFIVRKRTKTRDPIQIIVTQWQNEKKELTIPDRNIRTGRSGFRELAFCEDYACRMIEAAGCADEWAAYVNGNRR